MCVLYKGGVHLKDFMQGEAYLQTGHPDSHRPNDQEVIGEEPLELGDAAALGGGYTEGGGVCQQVAVSCPAWRGLRGTDTTGGATRRCGMENVKEKGLGNKSKSKQSSGEDTAPTEKGSQHERHGDPVSASAVCLIISAFQRFVILSFNGSGSHFRTVR